MEPVLAEFNGVSFWRSDLQLKLEFQVQTDAAGSLGFGGNGAWRCGLRSGISKALLGPHLLEFFPIVCALWLWAHEWANSSVRFWCDTQWFTL